MKSVTFLIGGKFSTSWDKFIPGTWGMGRRSRVVNWYKPMPRNFYELASKVWGDVYGNNRFGTVGFPNAFGQPEKYFGWEKTWRPSFSVITTAAEKLVERIDWIIQNHSDDKLKIRLVGHSAGCLVANRVTQLVEDKQFGIEEVVLCAPPVPDNANKFGLHWTKNEIQHAFPNLKSIAGGKFMYIPVKKDNVLSVHNVGTRYDSDFVSTHYGSVSAASVVPPDHLILSRRHWHPVSYTNWVRYYLEWYRDVSQIEFAPRNIVLTAKRRKVHI